MFVDNSSRFSSAYRHKKKYYNYSQEKSHAVFFSSAMMFFRSWIYRRFNKKPLSSQWVTSSGHRSLSVPTLTWIGHSTFLIEFDGIRILTDPIFGNASFLFKRIFPPGIALNQVASLDYILLSHNHRDHMDAQSLLNLRHHNPHVLMPQGDKKWFIQRGFRLATEQEWWQSSSFMHNNERITFTFLPAHHWSQRSLFDRNRSLWGSWMISYKDYTIYFAGDTAYAAHFAEIKQRFPTINVALMPIGPCEPHTLMKMAHLNAGQAGQAFLELGAKSFIPMHWGTFYFGIDTFSQPIEQLQTWWQEQNLDTSRLHILKIGQQWEIHKEVATCEELSQEVNVSLHS